MGAPMAIVMMLMMGQMYASRKTNTGIIVAAIIVFVVTFPFYKRSSLADSYLF
jgi:hypothetical protein